MRLKFGEQEWLHVIMAVRISQKVLTRGEHKTAAWNTATGRYILEELTRLVKRAPAAPQIATKIDLREVMGMMPDNDPAPVVACSGPSPGEAASAGIDPKTAKRLDALEVQVIELMTQASQAAQVKTPSEDDATRGYAQELRDFVNEENVKVFEFLGRLEDRIIALERRRK